jgi:hypothetical protein
LTYEQMSREPARPGRVLSELLGRRVDLPRGSNIARLSPGPLEASVVNVDEVRTWAAQLGITDEAS